MSDPGDTFTQVTSTSWIARLGKSILGVLIGIVLIIAAIVLLFWNEGRAVTTARSLAEGSHAVVAVGSASVDPANDGKLVYVSGDLTARAPLADQEFGVSANALRLVRKVEMYEWKEESKTERRDKLGGGEEEVKTYTYHRVWSDRYEDFEPLQAFGRPREPADALPRPYGRRARREPGCVPSGRAGAAPVAR